MGYCGSMCLGAGAAGCAIACIAAATFGAAIGALAALDTASISAMATG